MSKKFTHLKSGRFKLSPNEIGTFGEHVVEMLLRKDGFKVKPFGELLCLKRPCSKMPALLDICRENCKWESGFGSGNPKPCMNGHLELCHSYLLEYCSRVCKRFCRTKKVKKLFEEVGKEQRDRRRGGLDFVAYKDGKIWVVEVKTGTHSELDVSQKQFVERLRREMGIELLHFHVNLNDEIDYSVRCKSRQLPESYFTNQKSQR
jgi:hypothetical protein